MKKVLTRVIAIIPAVLIQLLWLFVLLRWLSPYTAAVHLLLSVFAILFVLYIISNRNEGTYKGCRCSARSSISFWATSAPPGP